MNCVGILAMYHPKGCKDEKIWKEYKQIHKSRPNKKNFRNIGKSINNIFEKFCAVMVKMRDHYFLTTKGVDYAKRLELLPPDVAAVSAAQSPGDGGLATTSASLRSSVSSLHSTDEASNASEVGRRRSHRRRANDSAFGSTSIEEGELWLLRIPINDLKTLAFLCNHSEIQALQPLIEKAVIVPGETVKTF
jgi:hypothetical protein